MIDVIYPPKHIPIQNKKIPKDGSDEFPQEKNSGDEAIVENVKDDLIDEEASDPEDLSTEKDTNDASSSLNVRKRKPRKAD